jgi:hypothetical protein
MTLPPPPPGSPGPPPQFGSGDPFGPPSQGGPAGYPGPQGGPPQHHAPQWQPPQQQQPPTWAPNPGAQPAGPPPKKRGNGWKWGLGAVALLAVIGVTAAVSITVVKGSGGDGGKTAEPLTSSLSQSPTASNSDIASANDTGPATIITEDPTCTAWGQINDALAKAETKAGWADHDYKIPATDWTPELRETYETMGKAMGAAADQAVVLVKKTPRRVMRELYEQFIAYSRAFANSLGTYTAVDNYLGTTAVNASIVASSVCEAINQKSAGAQAPFASDPGPPTELRKPGDPNNPERFISSLSGDCSKWQSLYDKSNADMKPWVEINPNTSADNWKPDERATIGAVIPVMKKYADDLESLGRGSGNPTIEDFAIFAAQYWRAYVASLPNYTPADYYLAQVAGRLPTVIVQACLAQEG